MKGLIAGLGSTLALLLTCLPGAHAAPGAPRIHHAEPVELAGLPDVSPQSRKPAGAVRSAFYAHGLLFELQLEANDRVLDRLSSRARKSLPPHALYRGTVVGRPGSWIRLTRLREGTHGLVYDGRELYVLAPAAAVAHSLDVPLNLPADATVVYRAADSDSPLGAGFCRVLQPPRQASTPGDGKVSYQSVLDELRAQAPAIVAAVPTRELDLALVGDTQLADDFANPTGEMLARLNNVDGIFSSQVGVKVVSGFVQVLTASGGMSSNAPDTLLEQFDAYRLATPAAATRGLAHLMTGRELTGSTVGIAYIGTLCAPQFAASLSQSMNNTFYSSLVAAHELGHNFGAPHDGVAGSECQDVPQSYLMAPSINGSHTFSSCSLGQVAPVVAEATCLRPASLADAAVELADASVVTHASFEQHVPIDVVSGGTLAVEDVSLTLTSSSSLRAVAGTVAGGACNVAGGGLTCQLGNLEPGTRRTVDVVIRDETPHLTSLEARVEARVDDDPGNDVATLQVDVRPAADGAIEVSTSASSAYVGEPQDFFVTARNLGPLALENVAVVLRNLAGFATTATGGSGVACAVGSFETTCSVGTLPAGESRRIDVRLVGQQARRQFVEVRIVSTNDQAVANDAGGLELLALPLVEWTVDAVPVTSLIRLGETVTQRFNLRSTGPQAVEAASFGLAASASLEVIDLAAPGAACRPIDAGRNFWQCDYASAVGSGETRTVDAVVRSVSDPSAYLIGTAQAPASQHLDPSLGQVNLQYQVRADVDAHLYAPSGIVAYDHQPVRLSFSVWSVGLTAATNTRLALTLTPGLRPVAASATLGACTVSTAGASCEIGTLAPGTNAVVSVDVVADAPASYRVAARLSADGDQNPTNDSADFPVDVLRDVDLAVTLPTPVRIAQGSTLDVPIHVQAGSQPVDGAFLRVSVGVGVSVVSAVPSQGSCDAASVQFDCRLGTVPANGSATVTLRLQGDTLMTTSLTVLATGSGDRDPGNGIATSVVTIVPGGDVALRALASSATATVGTPFDLPRFSVRAVQSSTDVRIDLEVPTGLSIESAMAAGVPCTFGTSVAQCTLGALAPGEVREVALRLRAARAGSYTVNATARAAAESNLGDNATSVAVRIDPDDPGGGGSSGGGGGGGLDAASLLLMLLAPVLRLRRRPAPVEIRSSCGRRARRCAR